MIAQDTSDAGTKHRARLKFLYASPFLLDNLTGLMMDNSIGDIGCMEESARAKAHAITAWIEMHERLTTETAPAPSPAAPEGPST